MFSNYHLRGFWCPGVIRVGRCALNRPLPFCLGMPKRIEFPAPYPLRLYCACGENFVSRWKLRRREQGGYRIISKDDCPKCLRNHEIMRTEGDRPEWDIRSTFKKWAKAA